MAKQINIREELNKRDAQSCTTDFVNMYECANLSLDKKKELAKLLAENKSNKVISKFFESAEGNQIAQDYIDSKNDNFEKDKEATREVRKELAKQGVATNVDGEPIRETFVDSLEQQIRDAIKNVFKGYDEQEYNDIIGDYLVIDIAPQNGRTKVEVRAELGYSSMDKIADALNPIVQRIDKDAYFDHDTSGVISAYVNKSLKESDEDLDESIAAGVAVNLLSAPLVYAVNSIINKFHGDKKSRWIDYKKHLIEITPEKVINVYTFSGEKVAENVHTVKAAKLMIKDIITNGLSKSSMAEWEMVEEPQKGLKEDSSVTDEPLTESEAYPDEDDEETAICQWCDSEYPISELKNEVDLGYLCPTCISAIKSRGEKLKFEENLKEEYGYYKDEPYCEEIADDLENGIWVGETSNGTSWELTINGYNSDEFSPSFADYLAEEVAYPVRDGHLAYIGIELVLYKSSMESIFGYDDLNRLIPDLVLLGISRKEIDRWLKDPDSDAELITSYNFDIAFDTDEWERNDREDVDLPTEVTYDFYSLVDDDVDINSDDYNLDDVIADRLSDDYGYTHFGFEYDVNAESGDVYVYDIKWDISESLKENVSDNKYNIKETEEEIFDILGIEPENYENSKHLLPQFRKLAREWDENNIWLKSDLGHYTKGKIVDETEDLVVVDESLKESRVTTNSNKQPLKPATFTIDDIHPFEGYDEEYYWNGWECPWFTKEVGDAIVNYYKDTMYFDEKEDAFVFTAPYGNIDEEDPDYFAGQDIETVDGVKHLYPIGNGSWTWDKYHEDEDLEEDYTHFTYKSGANPYIAKTDKETQRILNKYKGKVKETKKGFYEIDDTKEDSFITESVGELLSNEEFVKAYKEEGFEGAEIVLDWDKKQHTFEEWEELLLNTYLDLEQDLLAQGDFETVKHNRDTYINRIIGDKVLSESRPASYDYKGISKAIDRIIKPKHNETTNRLRFLIREASNLYFYAVNPHAFSSNPYNSSRELINTFRTDLLYVTYIDEYLYEWERELNNSLYNEEELSDIREFVNVLKEIKDIIINETPPKPNYLGDE